ncbi:hypothetical protein DFQ00_11666 [Paenibacillus barcinonensis]|uniref:Uncharacterized protein n=1 Tax=Paenibacillus barcinonensis TaxID=198119 RepID=A0A2V4VM49_PAEBA|nr:hypothetical protein DFQ00_11666 [Paenibacillus barcinonensis]
MLVISVVYQQNKLITVCFYCNSFVMPLRSLEEVFCLYGKREMNSPYACTYGFDPEGKDGLMYFILERICITIVINGKAMNTTAGPRLPNLNEARGNE